MWSIISNYCSSFHKPAGIQAANLITNIQDPPEGQSEPAEHSEKSNEENDLRILETLSDSKDINQVSVPSQRSLSGAASVASFFRNSVGKFCLPSRSQSQLPSLVVIVVAVIFLLMQVCNFSLAFVNTEIKVCYSWPGPPIWYEHNVKLAGLGLSFNQGLSYMFLQGHDCRPKFWKIRVLLE